MLPCIGFDHSFYILVDETIYILGIFLIYRKTKIKSPMFVQATDLKEI